jgi:hypothetical protein
MCVFGKTFNGIMFMPFFLKIWNWFTVGRRDKHSAWRSHKLTFFQWGRNASYRIIGLGGTLQTNYWSYKNGTGAQKLGPSTPHLLYHAVKISTVITVKPENSSSHIKLIVTGSHSIHLHLFTRLGKTKLNLVISQYGLLCDLCRRSPLWSGRNTQYGLRE